MYRICVSNSFTKRFTTYKTCLLKRDLNINEPEKKIVEKDDKSNNKLSALLS